MLTVHITRTSTIIIRMGKIDTGFGHMDGVTSRSVYDLCDKQVMKTRKTY